MVLLSLPIIWFLNQITGAKVKLIITKFSLISFFSILLRSISSTFYRCTFRTKVLHTAFFQLEKSCLKDFCMKKAHLKHWWNWHLVVWSNKFVPCIRSSTSPEKNCRGKMRGRFYQQMWGHITFSYNQQKSCTELYQYTKLKITSTFYFLCQWFPTGVRWRRVFMYIHVCLRLLFFGQ